MRLTLMRFCPSNVEVNPTRVFLQRLLHTSVRLCINESHSIRKLCNVAPQPVRYEHFNWANRQEFWDEVSSLGINEVKVVTLYSKQCKTLKKLIKIKSFESNIGFVILVILFSLSWLFSNCCWVLICTGFGEVC